MASPSLKEQIRAAWESGGEPRIRTSLIKSDHPERLPDHLELTPGEWQQLAAVKEHLRTVAKHDAWDQTPEGSAAAIVNKCTPNVRRAIALAKEYAENVEATGGRTELFQPRQEMPPVDPIDRKLQARSHHEEIVGGLHDRLGTADSQATLNDRPVNLRDVVTAAVDVHTPAGE